MLFPNDQKTLGVLKGIYEKYKRKHRKWKPNIKLIKQKHFDKQSKTNDWYNTVTETDKEVLRMSKITETGEKIAEKAAEGYKKVEAGVVEGYKKIENGVVEGFEKVTDKCIEVFFTKTGESVEDAKKRLSGENTSDSKEK